DTTLHTRIEGKLSFSAESARDVPVLAGPQAPSWMRCMLSWPIFTATKPHIRCQNAQWQYAIGELTRLDVLGQSERFFLEFHATAHDRVADLPERIHLEPGVYTLWLRGALGIEDVSLPFVYLPMTRCETVSASDPPSLVSDFRWLTEGPL